MMPKLLAPLFHQGIILCTIRLNQLLIFEVAINPLLDHSSILCLELIQTLHKQLSRCHSSLPIHQKNTCRKHFILCGISPVPRIPALNMMEPVNLVLWHTLILTGQVITKLADLPLDTLSSTEAEYVGMIEVAKQISWIRNLLSELKFRLPTVPLCRQSRCHIPCF